MAQKTKKIKKREKWYFGIVNFFLRMIFNIYARLTYNYRPKKFRLKRKTPYLILSNHLATLDPVFVGLSFSRPIIYVAGDGIFRKKLIAFFLRTLVNPISKRKGAADVTTIKEIESTLRQKSVVCLFPEGNRAYDGEPGDISPSIAKLVRMLKVNVLLYRLEGGYLSSPRWKHKGRRGFMTGYVKKMLTVEEIAAMTNDELYKAILDGIRVSTKELQQARPVKYKSKLRAEYLEIVTYRCCKCRETGTITSKGNFITCSNCGMKAEFTETGELKRVTEPIPFVYVNEWIKWQRDWLIESNLPNDGRVLAGDKCKVYGVSGQKENDEKEFVGEVVMTTESISFPFDGKILTVNFSEILSLAIQFQSVLCVVTKDQQYKVILVPSNSSPLKYTDAFYYFKAKANGEKPTEWGI